MYVDVLLITLKLVTITLKFVYYCSHNLKFVYYCSQNLTNTEGNQFLYLMSRMIFSKKSLEDFLRIIYGFQLHELICCTLQNNLCVLKLNCLSWYLSVTTREERAVSEYWSLSTFKTVSLLFSFPSREGRKCSAS